jgi:glycosyltransferase involved in cell wall biosynthesis
MLYAGQLVRHKGVHTAIEAVARLVNERGLDRVSLTVIGSGHPDYEAYLRDQVEKERIQPYVAFKEPVPREAMPAALHQHDILLFPSIYEEPLARITQEAMAAGLVVVGTTTGGTGELLKDRETGLTFAPEDADGLANQVAWLISHPEMARRVAHAGRQTVLGHFTLDRMLTEIEAYLLDCVALSLQS